jgi:hypothetical protein
MLEIRPSEVKTSTNARVYPKAQNAKGEKSRFHRVGEGAFGWTDWQHSVRRMTESNSI